MSKFDHDRPPNGTREQVDADPPDIDSGALLNTNRDFTLVERKKADLFYQQPDIEAIPSPLSEDTNQRATLGIHTAILNHKLGLTGEDVKDLYSRLLFDVLCTAGTGFSVMGYEAATVPVETQQPVGLVLLLVWLNRSAENG